MIAHCLVDACFANECVQQYLTDDRIPFFTEAGIRTNPIVRVEFEQAVAIGDIGSTLAATKSKSWGDGPQILPLGPSDWFYAERITYLYRPCSVYNRRFEQRRRLKELLGKRWRPLVERAKSQTKTIFLRDLTEAESRAIQRILDIDAGEFWRIAKGRKLVTLPPGMVQREFDFGDDSNEL